MVDLHKDDLVNIVERPVATKLGETLRLSSGKMEMQTTFQGDYRQFTPKRPVIHRTDTSITIEGEMEKSSHSHSVYLEGVPER